MLKVGLWELISIFCEVLIRIMYFTNPRSYDKRTVTRSSGNFQHVMDILQAVLAKPIKVQTQNNWIYCFIGLCKSYSSCVLQKHSTNSMLGLVIGVSHPLCHLKI